MSILVIGSLVVDVNDTFHTVDIGGDACNEAIFLKRMGHEVKLCASIGLDEYTDEILHSLQKEGLCTDYISIHEQEKTTVSHIVLDQQKDRHFKVDGGAHRNYSKADFRMEWLDGVEAISIASLFSIQKFQDEGLINVLKEACRRGMPVFADTSRDRNHLGVNAFAQLLPYITCFMPGYEEIGECLNEYQYERIVSILRSYGAQTIVLKCGEAGAYYDTGEETKHIPAVKQAQIVDTTGCGDCFCAVMIHSLLKQMNMKDAVSCAVEYAGKNTQYKGAHNLPL